MIIKRHCSPVAALGFALLAAGCDAVGERAPSAGVGLSPPAPLMQSRAIVIGALRPVVTIDGQFDVPMAPTGDGTRWRGTIDVPPNRDYALTVIWTERVESGGRSRDLPLARLDRTVPVDADGTEFTLATADGYRYEPGDGLGATCSSRRPTSTSGRAMSAPSRPRISSWSIAARTSTRSTRSRSSATTPRNSSPICATRSR